jgi:Replication stress response SDE2 C-terminal
VASESAAEFVKLWEVGKGLEKWTRTAAASTSTTANKAGRTLDLSMYYSAEDLKPLGMERLKEALEVKYFKSISCAVHVIRTCQYQMSSSCDATYNTVVQ